MRCLAKAYPVVLLHGSPVDHRHMVADFDHIFQRRDGWKRIYPDLPGHGKTPGVDWITNKDQILEVILDFIDNMIPGQRFVIVGVSWGAYFARGVVHKRSTLVDGLLLGVPNVTPDKHSPPPHVALVKDETLISELRPGLESKVFGILVVQSRKALDYIRAYFLPAVEIADTKFLAKVKGGFSFDPDALPEPFDKPTLILCGRQDSMVGYREAWNILENYPRATFVVLDRAGHELHLEQKELFNVLVNEWLDRVEESAGPVTV